MRPGRNRECLQQRTAYNMRQLMFHLQSLKAQFGRNFKPQLGSSDKAGPRIQTYGRLGESDRGGCLCKSREIAIRQIVRQGIISYSESHSDLFHPSKREESRMAWLFNAGRSPIHRRRLSPSFPSVGSFLESEPPKNRASEQARL